jgi:DNA-directed RNA polymerase subunit RPC12/RpoP
MIVGCYSLDLYCDKPNDAHEYKEFPHEFNEEHGSTCRAEARKKGWVLNVKDGTAICPKCSGKRLARLRKLVAGIKYSTFQK